MSLSLLSSRTAPGVSPSRFSHPEISVSVCLDCGTPIPARLEELARMDLMLLTDRPLRFGTSIQLAIFSDLVSAVTYNRAVVHWSRPHSCGWQIGAFLTQPLPDRLIEQSWNDLRTALRYDCNWKGWLLLETGGELEPVRILQYSISGLCMRTETMIPVNSRFSLFGTSATCGPAVISGQIDWCRTVEESIQAGGIIHGQKGRDLPRLFESMPAVHLKPVGAGHGRQSESLETLRCELQGAEQFLSPIP